MLNVIRTRLRQGHRTTRFPVQLPVLPEHFRGLPRLDAAKCPNGCQRCVEVCPTDAFSIDGEGLQLDMGRCLFCTDCQQVCPADALHFTPDYQLAARTRPALCLGQQELRLADALEHKLQRLFGRSLKLRQVSAGGCNACEADVNVLNTIVFDIGRFGIQFVASPRRWTPHHRPGHRKDAARPRKKRMLLCQHPKSSSRSEPVPSLVAPIETILKCATVQIALCRLTCTFRAVHPIR